jgi:hypothetical protein
MMAGDREYVAPAVHATFLAPNPDDEELSEEEIEENGAIYSFRSPYLLDRAVLSVRLHGMPKNIWENCGTITALSLPIARIVFNDVPYDLEGEISDESVRFRACIDEFYRDLSDAGVFKMFAQVMATGVAEQYGIVLNLTKLLYTLRYYAPVFEKYPVLKLPCIQKALRKPYDIDQETVEKFFALLAQE